MKYPKLRETASSRQMVDTFKGYNHNLRIGEGEFFDMKNMTSDYYPVLSPRGKRGIYAAPEQVTELIGKDCLCYVDGPSFVINDYAVDMELTEGKKQLVSMGAYVIILPDKKYINTADLSDWGELEAKNDTSETVEFSLCRADGTDYGEIPAQNTAPEEPENGDLWIDTSSTPHTLMQYSVTSSLGWVQMPTTYIRLKSPGIGKGLSQYDGVTISGVMVESLTELNGTFALQDVGNDYILITGILDKAASQDDPVTVARTVPDMDFVTECGNRLWGCRYGFSAEGKVVNEIYCSKLGDFKNWNCFMGISTDSWAGSLGTDGPFTGAITHLGYPVFFKENYLHKVYPSEVGAHSIQDTACRGVQKGSERSLAIVNEVLYYKGRNGVCAYDGSLPVEVSGDLGDKRYENAVAGAHGNKYYISMADCTNGEYSLFVYDAVKGLWHREDDLHAETFCSCRGDMYAIADGKIITMLGSGDVEEDAVEWMVQTGEIGLSSPDMKYITRLTVRMALDVGAEVRIYAQYNFSEEWECQFVLRSTNLRSFSIPIRPRRCDFMRLRIEGEGIAKIYSITKTMEQGSELS